MRSASLPLLVAYVWLAASAPELHGAEPVAPVSAETAHGDNLVHEYFVRRTAELSGDTARRLKSGNWKSEAEEYRRQLHEMLGLDPLPPRTPLHPVITKTAEHDDFLVDNLHFQSSPGLYVTGNLYRPKEIREPLPAILYVCGHGKVKIDGVSYGNKAHYHHHGVWFARHGYICLVIDSVQLGEIEGLHHGTHNLNMWWWVSRGYSPAGVEAWNCIRALDYLETRSEVDKTRLGVTGRSGGGAYSWWTAALDPRIQCAVPVAGITDLDDHVVRGCVEGHCDCMYLVNTYQWDYPLVAALVAPRPLLISNTDKDGIFPLEGVVHTYLGSRDAYRTSKTPDALGLQITEGGHVDTQELRVHAMVWFDRFLKKVDRPITPAAVKVLPPQELRVFDALPADQINTRIHETFVPLAAPPIPVTKAEWQATSQTWIETLSRKTFGAWPTAEEVEGLYLKCLTPEGARNWAIQDYEFNSQAPYRLGLKMQAGPKGDRADVRKVVLHVLTQAEWDKAAWEQQADPAAVHFWFAPRGVGPTQWTQNPKKNTHVRRRFYLLGETDDSARTWDVRRAITAVREILGEQEYSLVIEASGDASVWALYASLFEADPDELRLADLPDSHMTGPALLNVLKTLDVPQAVALAAARTKVVLTDERPQDSHLSFWMGIERLDK